MVAGATAFAELPPTRGAPSARSDAAAEHAVRLPSSLALGVPPASVSVASGAPFAWRPAVAYVGEPAPRFEADNVPPWITFDPATGALAGTPPASIERQRFDDLAVRGRDSHGERSTETFSLAVMGATRAPDAFRVSGVPGIEDVPFGTWLSFHPTITSPARAHVRYEVRNGPPWMTLEPNGQFHGVAGQPGEWRDVRIVVDDGVEPRETPPFTLRVGAEPPTSLAKTAQPVGAPGHVEIAAGDAWAYASTVIVPEPLLLTYTLDNAPPFLTIDGASGRAFAVPGPADVGVYAGIAVRVTTPNGVEVGRPFTLTVRPASVPAPAIDAVPPLREVAVGARYTFRPGVTSFSLARLRWSIEGQPRWARFDPATGTMSGTPRAADVGPTGDIVLQVDDGVRTTVGRPFRLEVTRPVNSPAAP
jgi:hypothetical protein